MSRLKGLSSKARIHPDKMYWNCMLKAMSIYHILKSTTLIKLRGEILYSQRSSFKAGDLEGMDAGDIKQDFFYK